MVKKENILHGSSHVRETIDACFIRLMAVVLERGFEYDCSVEKLTDWELSPKEAKRGSNAKTVDTRLTMFGTTKTKQNERVFDLILKFHKKGR